MPEILTFINKCRIQGYSGSGNSECCGIFKRILIFAHDLDAVAIIPEPEFVEIMAVNNYVSGFHLIAHGYVVIEIQVVTFGTCPAVQIIHPGESGEKVEFGEYGNFASGTGYGFGTAVCLLSGRFHS